MELDVELNTVAVMFYSGNYGGYEPPYDIEGLKEGDIAFDVSVRVLWTYKGGEWIRSTVVSGDKILLANGLTIRECLENAETVIPSYMECYAGDDDNVPEVFRLSSKDLVIKHSLGNPVQIYASYLDEDACIWRNVNPDSGVIATDVDCVWSIWTGFADKFLPHKTLISIVSIGNRFEGNIDYNESSSLSSESSASSESSENGE